jgi:D-serine deaminase-like pyridoxal phosphate-dependent protein
VISSVTLQEIKIGTSVEDLETPSIIIDSEIMEENLRDMADFARKAGKKLRPHSKTHKIPELALKQIDYGAVGVCSQKVSEAKVMIDNGVKDVMITNQVIAEEKLQVLAQLAEKAKVSVCVDGVPGIELLQNAARDNNVELRCLIEIDSGMHRSGVTPSEAAELAKLIAKSEGLIFDGIMGFEGQVNNFPKNEWPPIVKEAMDVVSKAKSEIEHAGILVENVVVGGTPSAKIVATFPDVTEITPGEYIFYDYEHLSSGLVPIRQCALSVLSTVVSRPAPERAILDAGCKTFDFDECRFPGPKDPSLKVKFVGLSEEHGTVILEDEPTRSRFRIGEKLEFLPYHVCPCVNLHDEVFFYRRGRIEKISKVLARGKVY